MTEQETKIWHEAFAIGSRSAAVQLFELLCADKLDLMKELFQKAAAMDSDPEWDAYAEGMRHALQIVKNRGPAMEAYNGIIRRSMDPLTGTKGETGNSGPTTVRVLEDMHYPISDWDRQKSRGLTSLDYWPWVESQYVRRERES